MSLGLTLQNSRELFALMSKDDLHDAQVLVLAPLFPSINQPWMDTYLEQLQRSGIQFCVLSNIKIATNYHDKVDRLELRRRVITVSMDTQTVLVSSVSAMVLQPAKTWRWLRRTWYRLLEPKLKTHIGSLLRALHAARRIHAFEQLKLIHVHSLSMGYEFLPAAWGRRLPMVITFHGLEPSGVPQIPAHQRQALFDYATRVLVNTHFARRHAMALGCPGDKITIIPQGLPLEDFPFIERPAPTAGEPLEVLTVGRYHRDKGQAYALLALRRLRNQGLQIRWHFVGVGPDQRRLMKLAQRLGVIAQIAFHVNFRLDELRNLYQKCHLFILTSLNNMGQQEWVETQGVVLQEAQASGCIPIATQVGGIPECINDQKDGLLIRDRSHRAIADAVLTMMAMPTAWPDYQRHGRRNVEERFSADVIGQRMASILKAAMTNQPWPAV